MLIKVIKKQTIFLLKQFPKIRKRMWKKKQSFFIKTKRSKSDIYITSSGSAGELYNECSHI